MLVQTQGEGTLTGKTIIRSFLAHQTTGKSSPRRQRTKTKEPREFVHIWQYTANKTIHREIYTTDSLFQVAAPYHQGFCCKKYTESTSDERGEGTSGLLQHLKTDHQTIYNGQMISSSNANIKKSHRPEAVSGEFCLGCGKSIISMLEF